MLEQIQLLCQDIQTELLKIELNLEQIEECKSQYNTAIEEL